ncbi:conjugative transfer signal peptidase TraF [Pseudaminobacter soli (ex Li et al. 2025)]|uniref:conjugative transfer signal peptidase TraF n=1 Tax=Pseudaminobacter soli (ex Li et al. 2025) TaxID=1295366 RepID=UPI001FE206EA|nr:conjugative transfer signal peptidase TraF [Mesorhizobium soli]
MQRRRAVAILAAGGVAVAVVAVIVWLGGLRINLTPSEPLGLWRIVPLARHPAAGDLVVICPPAGSVSAFALGRGYFRRGLCPGGAAPLIKAIAAAPGACIKVGADVAIDGVPLPRSRLSPVDGQGRSLSPWAGGVVPPGHLFLHSSFAGSYDSRYFGPVPEVGLLGLARPVLLFDP